MHICSGKYSLVDKPGLLLYFTNMNGLGHNKHSNLDLFCFILYHTTSLVQLNDWFRVK